MQPIQAPGTKKDPLQSVSIDVHDDDEEEEMENRLMHWYDVATDTEPLGEEIWCALHASRILSVDISVVA